MVTLCSLSVSAVTIDGQNYNVTMTGRFLTSGLKGQKYNGSTVVNADEGHTANLIGSVQQIRATGTWFNTVLGYDRSVSTKTSSYVNGAVDGKVLVTQNQLQTVNLPIGYDGTTSSAYRRFSKSYSKEKFEISGKLGKKILAIYYTLPKPELTAHLEKPLFQTQAPTLEITMSVFLFLISANMKSLARLYIIRAVSTKGRVIVNPSKII